MHVFFEGISKVYIFMHPRRRGGAMQLPATGTDANVLTYFLYSNKVSGHNMFHSSRLIVASSFAVHNGGEQSP
jgi:hypothetical protein